MAVALGVLLISRRLETAWLAAPLAASTLLYGLGYLIFSVASDYRYHLWTVAGSAIAAMIAGSDLLRGAERKRLAIWVRFLAPALIVAAIGSVARVV